MRHPGLADTARHIEWHKLRLLVFGTDDSFRFLVRQTFRKLGTREVTSYGAVADTSGLAARGVDLVLVDLSGESDEGLAVIERLRAHHRSDLPVMVVTPTPRGPAVDRARILGIEGVIPKPVSGHELTLRVADTLVAPVRQPPPPSLRRDEAVNHVRPAPPPAPPSATFPPPVQPLGARPSNGASAAPPPAPATAFPRSRTGSAGFPAAGDLPPRRRPSGGRLEEDDLAPPVAAAPPRRFDDRDLASLPDDAERRRREARRRRVWESELAENGHVRRAGRDLAGIDLTPILADHARWLDTQGAEGQRASFSGRDLAGLDLTAAVLPQASFRETDLSDASLAQARLDGADFRRAVLSAADLGGADLGVATLRHARLDLANLEGAALRGADLSGAILSRARLAGTDFAGAVLVGADLRDADLSKADGLTQSQIDRTLCGLDTRLPPGLCRPPGQGEV